MEYPFSIKVISEEETAGIAAQFASQLQGGEVIIVNGNLGAGKTFFIKHAGLYFNIRTVYSPTFSIVNEYSGSKKINHFDFYRINSAAELYNIGFDDYLSEDESITFIEWGNVFPEVLPGHRIEINIIVNDDNTRDINFIKYEPETSTGN